MLVLAVALLCGMVWDDIENYCAAINAAGQSNFESDSVVISLASADLSEKTQPALSIDVSPRLESTEFCTPTGSVDLSLLELPKTDNGALLHSIALKTVEVALASTNQDTAGVGSYARFNMFRKFGPVYDSIRKAIALTELDRIRGDAALAGATVLGTVSTYNPFRDGDQEGDPETASGEVYDPDAWTAAIQIDLRSQFGGVRYGGLYRPAYALVENGDKQIIVKVNDVGRLKPGRVLDLNERAMRYFDPFLTRGLLADVKITSLPGEDWTPGPVGNTSLIDFAATHPVGLGQFMPIEPSILQSKTTTLRQIQPFIVESNAGAGAKPGAGG